MKNKTVVLATLLALLLGLLGRSTFASGPDRALPEWAFAQHSDEAQSLVVRVRLATTPPETAAQSIGIARLIKPPPAVLPPVSDVVKAAVMRSLDSTSTRAVVDLEHAQVLVRRGDVETRLPIEFRGSHSADAKTIADVAQAGTMDPWIVPYSIVVDGERIGLRIKDGETHFDAAILEPSLNRHTDKTPPPSGSSVAMQ